MGFLGGITKSITSAISHIAPAITQAVSSLAPAVTSMATGLLKNLTSGFDGAVNALKNFATSALPGPIGQLASKFLGPIADQLKGGLGGGIQNFLKDILSKLSPQTLADTGQTLTPPSVLGGRDLGGDIGNIMNVLKDILAKMNGGGAAPAAGSAGGAATAAPSTPAAGSAGSAATGTPAPTSTTANPVGGGTGSAMDILRSGLSSNASSLSDSQNEMLKTVTDPKQKAMMAAQFAMQNMQETCAFISNMMKKQNEIAMQLINNLR
jgi:hypothetical protein